MSERVYELTEASCKSLLQKSAMGFCDYSLNPYGGCAFGCSFCYVPSLRKFRGQEWKDWGRWVVAKTNAIEVLRKELPRIGPRARILIGSATDAWQPVEKRFGITRAILEELVNHSNRVSIITRSPLLLRDIPLLQQLAQNGGVHVGLSLSTFDERARRVFEPRSPAVAGREHLARALVGAQVPMSLFWAPLLPGVSDNAAAVEEYFRRAAALGVPDIMCDLLNYRESLGPGYSERLRAYYALSSKETGRAEGRPALGRAALAREVVQWASYYGIDCRPGFA